MRVGILIGLASWVTGALGYGLVMYGSLAMALYGLGSVLVWESLTRVWKVLREPDPVTVVPVRLEHAREDSLAWAYSLVVEDLKARGFTITADMVHARGPSHVELYSEEPITLTYSPEAVEAKLGDVPLEGDYVEAGESTLVKGGWDY